MQKMNVRLLRKVKRHILDEPRRYDQNGILSTGLEPSTIYRQGERQWRVPSCGTVACIGGWAFILAPGTKPPEMDFDFAQNALGLTGKQRDRLFAAASDLNIGYWPEKFVRAYQSAKSPAARASVAAERIEHFIATKGKE